MSTINAQYAYINAFNLIPGIGPQKLHLISKHFNNFEKAWTADKTELISAKIPIKLADNIIVEREKINIKSEWQKIQDANIKIVTINDSLFPNNLKTITSPPFLLYVRGNIDLLNSQSVAVVGSRKISDYGKHAMTSIINDIAQFGVTIVSGLALGTDALAHREALDIGGATIAVLGGGIDDATITPRSHINLAKQILDNDGAIISEYPIGTQPSRGTFPARNRIMAGLADATIIIEATKKSGTLITASHAHKFGRKLFALPGSIFATNSLGPNILIRDKKATALLCSDDILCIFKDTLKGTQKNNKNKTIQFENQIQERLFKTIKKHSEGIQINKIIKEINLDATTISSELTMMEIDGLIKNIGNQVYIVIKN